MKGFFIMKGIIKEVVSKENRPFGLILLEILAGIIIINVLITLTNHLGKRYAGVVSIFILIFFLAFLAYIILKFISYYNYKIVDEELIFEKIVGSKSKIILSVNFDEIIGLSKYTNIEKEKDIDKTYKFVCSKEYEDFYVGEFIREGKKYRFVFKPSERFINVIDSNLNKKLSQI